MPSPRETGKRGSAIDIDSITIRRVKSTKPPLGRAIPAGTGVAHGLAAFTVKTAQEFSGRGTPTILIRNEVATSDIAGLAVVDGVLTAAGGRTSHAAVVARQMGKVCLVGCTELLIDEKGKRATLGQTVIYVGDPLCLDGDAGTIYANSPKITSEQPEALITGVKEWRTKTFLHQ